MKTIVFPNQKAGVVTKNRIEEMSPRKKLKIPRRSKGNHRQKRHKTHKRRNQEKR